MSDNEMFPIYPSCAKTRDYKTKEVEYLAKLEYANTLGRTVQYLPAQRNCDGLSSEVEKKMQEAKLPVLGHYCSKRKVKDETEERTWVIFLDFLTPKLKTYTSFSTATKDQCESGLQRTSNIFTGNKRTVLWGYCHLDGVGKDAKYQYQIHFKEPKLVLKPKP
jgi:hypothetical protein